MLNTSQLKFGETHIYVEIPLRCWVQGDNAVKEVRNAYTGRWASLLCQGGWFKGVAHHHLVVGHTHEDIGLLLQNQKCVSSGLFQTVETNHNPFYFKQYVSTTPMAFKLF